MHACMHAPARHSPFSSIHCRLGANWIPRFGHHIDLGGARIKGELQEEVDWGQDKLTWECNDGQE